MMTFSSFFSLVIWVIIIIGIIRFVKKLQKPQDKKTDDESRPMNPTTRPPVRTYQNPALRPPQAPSERPLKRCPNCGGEIPVEMMKCDICGKRLIGCGSTTGWFIFIVIVGSLLAIMNKGGIHIEDLFRMIFK